jgi:uncharacterized protein (DUF1684 family)
MEYDGYWGVALVMHTTHVLEFRDEKDRFFKLAPQSPLPETERHAFSGLSYYEPDEAFVFSVDLQPVEPTDILISTTTGDERTYTRVATATITVDGEDATIALYSTGHESLFLPFRDATSGSETYGAGRYIDVDPNEDGTVTIDFNYAYAPFCAYSDRYSCALPPQENWLSVAIRAGERKPV